MGPPSSAATPSAAGHPSRDHEDPASSGSSSRHGNNRHAVTTASLAAQRASTGSPATSTADHPASSSVAGSTSSSVTARPSHSPGSSATTTQQRQASSISHHPTTSSSSNNTKLAQAEAAAAAALGGSLDTPAASPSTPASTATMSGGGSAGTHHDMGIGSSAMSGRNASKGEGTITNSAAVGPPTPSATRMPFLPSALKKHTSSSNKNSSVPRNSSDSGPYNSSSSSISHYLHKQKNSEGNPLSSSSSKEKKDRKKDKLASKNADSFKEIADHVNSNNSNNSNDFDTSATSSISSTNAYEKSYNASAAKVHSKRDREEAKEEREKERLFGSNMGGLPSSLNSSNQPVNSTSSSMQQAQMGNSSSPVNMQSHAEGWPLNHTTEGSGMSLSNSMRNDHGGQPLSKKKSKTPSKNTTTRMVPSDAQTVPTSLGFASPHMSPALLEAGGGRFTRENSYMQSSSNPGEGTKKTAREIQEEEENLLAAKLGGGIGPTSSRIKKSTKKGPTSPNNIHKGGDKERDYMNKEGESSSMRKRNGTAGNTGDLLGEDSEGERINIIRRNNDDSDGDNGNSNSRRKETQLQFSPKVGKPRINLSWRAIKRKFLLASTGTPSSGEGSRRSETSETSGGSRRRMYAAAASQHPHAHHGEKSVHIQGMDDGLGQEDWEVDQVSRCCHFLLLFC